MAKLVRSPYITGITDSTPFKASAERDVRCSAIFFQRMPDGRATETVAELGEDHTRFLGIAGIRSSRFEARILYPRYKSGHAQMDGPDRTDRSDWGATIQI
ncbi:hypothetical protein Trydic_g14236 [Trypoxylus dichotomus]